MCTCTLQHASGAPTLLKSLPSTCVPPQHLPALVPSSAHHASKRQEYSLRHQYSGATRVVLREAARFAVAYQPCVEFTQDDHLLQKDSVGPPSLLR